MKIPNKIENIFITFWGGGGSDPKNHFLRLTFKRRVHKKDYFLFFVPIGLKTRSTLGPEQICTVQLTLCMMQQNCAANITCSVANIRCLWPILCMSKTHFLPFWKFSMGFGLCKGEKYTFSHECLKFGQVAIGEYSAKKKYFFPTGWKIFEKVFPYFSLSGVEKCPNLHFFGKNCQDIPFFGKKLSRYTLFWEKSDKNCTFLDKNFGVKSIKICTFLGLKFPPTHIFSHPPTFKNIHLCQAAHPELRSYTRTCKLGCCLPRK